MKTKLTFLALAVLVAPMALPQSGTAQDRPAVPTTIPPPAAAQSLPRPDFHFPGSVGRTFEDSDPPTFPGVVRAPKGAPNVLLILLDDVGFGQFSAFGGGVPSPNIEKLAARGLRYTRFHTTALCSPTRAALLTGRDHHVAGTGVITELATGYDGYTGIIPKSAGTVSEILRQNGYATAWMQRTKAIDPARPFFLYVAPGATHSPHMAPKAWLDKFKGQFDMGWDRYREMTLERQKKLGVVPATARLTARPESLPAWDSL